MRQIMYIEAIREALREELNRDKDVFLLGEDIGEYGGAFGVTRDLFSEFGPERIRNTPMSESAITGIAAGAAINGLRPVAELMFMDFITLAMDQILNHMSKFRYMYNGQVKVPVTIRTPAGAGRGYGPTHSQSLEAWLMNVPGIKIAAPSTPYDAKGLLKSAIRDDNPVVFIENKLLYAKSGEVPEKDYTLEFGKAAIRREGTDITLIAHSGMNALAMEAAIEPEKEGISAEVIDPRTLKPLDIKTITNSIKKTHKAVIIEEGCKLCGIGAEIASQIIENAFGHLDAPVRRIAAADVPIACCPSLERAAIPSRESIIKAVKEIKDV